MQKVPVKIILILLVQSEIIISRLNEPSYKESKL
jgi:hypothetical protein